MSGADLQIVREEAPELRYGRKIAAAWQRSVEGILEVGRLLLDAKAELETGSFEGMVEMFCPFSDRTAQRLMKIARHPVLADPTHVSALPPAWGTLAELARVEPDRLSAAIDEGLVAPDMTRAATRELVYRAPKREREAAREAEAPAPATVSETETPKPTPAAVLREIAEDTGSLVAQIENMKFRARQALESGDFGAPRERVREYGPAEHLNDLAHFLEEAEEQLGGTYDDLAAMLGTLPTREQA